MLVLLKAFTKTAFSIYAYYDMRKKIPKQFKYLF